MKKTRGLGSKRTKPLIIQKRSLAILPFEATRTPKKRKKRQEKPRQKFTSELLRKAIRLVKEGVPIRQVSADTGVPKSTIHDNCKFLDERDELDQDDLSMLRKSGPPPAISAKEEKMFVDWILYCAIRGFPIKRDVVLDSIKSYLDDSNRKTSFTNNRPGSSWHAKFSRNHPEIVEQSNLSDKNLSDWFAKVRTHLGQNYLLGIDSSRVFNCDEFSLNLNPSSRRTMTKRLEEEEHLSTLFTYNAAGTRAPPMILYRYDPNEPVPQTILRNSPEGWGIGNPFECGWRTTETFYEYITSVFHPWLLQENIRFPIVLYLNAHKAHITFELAKFCQQNKIELIALFQQPTRVMRPLHVGFFQPFEEIWKKVVIDWRVKHEVSRLRKEQFPTVLEIALNSLNFEKSDVRNAFRNCGLYPFNPNAVDNKMMARIPKKENKCKPTPAPSIPNVAAVDSEDRRCLQGLEKSLTDDLLVDFRLSEAIGTWQGEIQNLGLYLYWLQLRKKVTGE